MKPIGRSIARYFISYKKDIAVLLCVIIFSIIIGTTVYGRVESLVIIKDDDITLSVKTMNRNPEQILEQHGFSLGVHDDFKLNIDDDNVNTIKIKRAIPITIFVDGSEHIVYTTKRKVRDVLEDNVSNFTKNDKVQEADLNDELKSGMELSLVRVEKINETIKEELDFDVVRRKSEELIHGEEELLREGEKGLVERTFKVVKENGIEVARELLSEVVLVPSVNKLVGYGAKNSYRTSRGDVIRARKVIDMSATSYTSSYACTGKTPDHPYFGITATGKQAREGYVAVDPNIIPLGTKLYVELKDGLPDYGFAEAQDTGGAVKGNIIDLYFDDPQRVQEFGRRRAKVYILE